MPRAKNPTYTYIEAKKLYRKKIKALDGKWVCLYAPTPAELTEKIEAAQRALEDQRDARERPTVEEYARQWLEIASAGKGYKYREQLSTCVKVHIVPALGPLYLQEVRYDDCAALMAGLAGRSSSLQSKVLGTLRQIFTAAQKSRLIRDNPCDDLKAAGVKAKEKAALSASQIKTLEEAVAGTPAETVVLLGLYAGLRREEMLGLAWDCVELDGDTPFLTVTRALRWEHNRPIVSDKLKSKAARRTIPLPGKLRDHLAALPRTGAYVVGGEPVTETQWRNIWSYIENRQTGEKTYRTRDGKKKTIRRELGQVSRGHHSAYTIDFEVTPHQLRHTYITNLILGGANIKRVQYLAGHSNIRVTMEIYTHLVERSPEALAGDVLKVFG